MSPSTQPTLNAVVFDLDGVIRHWDPRIFGDAEADAGLPAGALADAVLHDPDTLLRAVTGRLTDDQWRSAISERLYRAYGHAGPEAVAAWSASSGVVVPEVLELVRWTRQRARVALLTNATTRLRRDLANLGILDEFDFVFNSAELGLAKPHEDTFTTVCGRMSLEPTSCAFVDDTPGHVRAASSVGMVAHHFVGADALRSFLLGQRYV